MKKIQLKLWLVSKFIQSDNVLCKGQWASKNVCWQVVYVFETKKLRGGPIRVVTILLTFTTWSNDSQSIAGDPALFRPRCCTDMASGYRKWLKSGLRVSFAVTPQSFTRRLVSDFPSSPLPSWHVIPTDKNGFCP